MHLERKGLWPTHLVAIICLLVIADQVIKAVIRINLPPGSNFALIDDVLRFNFVQNYTGFSWWVPPLPAWAKVTFQLLLFFIVLAGFPVYVFYTSKRRRSIWANISFVGVIAACLGHLLDDFFAPFTTDFIQIFHSPSANFADIYAYLGISALTIETIVVFRIRKPKWKGFRHLLNAKGQIRKEFMDFFRKDFHSSK